MTDLYLLICEIGEYSDYAMSIVGIFDTLEMAAETLLITIAGDQDDVHNDFPPERSNRTKEQCLQAISTMKKETDLYYECFSIQKLTLNKVTLDDGWRISLTPSVLVGSAPDYYRNFSAPEGFRWIRTYTENKGPICCESKNEADFAQGIDEDGGSCTYCDDHDHDFTLTSEFLDQFNEAWIKRFHSQHQTLLA